MCSLSFSHSWLITGILTWVTRRVALVEQKLFTPPVTVIHPVRMVRYLVYTRCLVVLMLLNVKFSEMCIVDNCLPFCPLSFDKCIVWPLIYGFWLSLWDLQTLIVISWMIDLYAIEVSHLVADMFTIWY